jgi:hypothetical protein
VPDVEAVSAPRLWISFPGRPASRECRQNAFTPATGSRFVPIFKVVNHFSCGCGAPRVIQFHSASAADWLGSRSSAERPWCTISSGCLTSHTGVCRGWRRAVRTAAAPDFSNRPTETYTAGRCGSYWVSATRAKTALRWRRRKSSSLQLGGARKTSCRHGDTRGVALFTLYAPLIGCACIKS